MTDILAAKACGDNILSAHNEIRTAVNEGRIPVLTEAEIAALMLINEAGIAYNTTSDNFEVWTGTTDRRIIA